MFNVAITVDDGLAEKQWSYTLCHFKPDNIIVMGNYQLTNKAFLACDRVIPDDVPVVLFAAANGRHIQGEISLLDFEHPKDATYVFGSDHKHVDPNFPHDVSVYIPFDDDTTAFSWVAGALALWDRRHG